MQKIFPCLWFNHQAHEAAQFYCSVFGDASIVQQNEYVSIFEASGQRFMCLNGCAHLRPNPSVSFFVLFENVSQLQQCWQQLNADGQVFMPLDRYDWSELYGWVQDKYGVSWQLYLGKLSEVGQRFTPSIMFTGINAGKTRTAIEYYTSIFPDSSVTGIMHYGDGDKDAPEYVKHAQFSLIGQTFMAMDSGTTEAFPFNDAVSLILSCKNQEEIDYYWLQLTKNGSEGPCGWLTDRFGLSWQVLPEVLNTLMADKHRAPRVREAFMKMKKLDIDTLMNA